MGQAHWLAVMWLSLMLDPRKAQASGLVAIYSSIWAFSSAHRLDFSPICVLIRAALGLQHQKITASALYSLLLPPREVAPPHWRLHTTCKVILCSWLYWSPLRTSEAIALWWQWTLLVSSLSGDTLFSHMDFKPPQMQMRDRYFLCEWGCLSPLLSPFPSGGSA